MKKFTRTYINPLKIYIAGPYSADTEEERVKNVEVIVSAGIKLFRKGHIPYIPHLTHYVDILARRAKIKFRWKDYMIWHGAWLKLCDAFLFMGSSRGADLEHKIAKRLRKKIFYSVKDIPKANKTKFKIYTDKATDNL